uniref:GB1/RHD3-type G domain-containing protein n=1 Tax=Strigamia maritima TaxID=126957 RepID=T1J895_STRMM
MADWPAPQPFITCERNKFKLNDETVSLLQQIHKPLVVVCIAGSYRTGKSYLMNRLAGKSTGFALGNTIESKTKGIWVWYINHRNDGLLVMDTEGLDDPMKGDETNDMQILSLSILLSSTFIYNAVGKLDNSVVDKMDFVTDISKHIKVRSHVETDSDFDSIFPHFVLVCRDKTLELKMNGRDVTADEYMERVMLTANKKAVSPRETKRNETKMKLRNYFPKRKCFFFVRPTSNDDDMLRLEEINDDRLQPDFKSESEKFCKYILEKSTVKKLDQTQPVTGEILVHLAKIYMEAINNKAVPCIGSASQLVASTENNKLLVECVGKYKELMANSRLPLSTDEFRTVHQENHKNVVDYFSRKHFLDENMEIHRKLQLQLQQEYLICVERNCKESEKVCNDILNGLFEPIQRKIRGGAYLTNGGYNQFVQDSEDLQRKYKCTPKKGTSEDIILEKFIIRLQKDQNTILQADKMLSEAEQKLEEERLLQEQIRMNCEIQKEEKRKEERRHDALLKSHEEQMRALKESYEAKLEEDRREFEKILAAREKEHQRLMEEEFEEEARRLRQRIESLEQEQRSKKKGIFRSLLNTAGSLLLFVPNPFAKAAGIGMQITGKFI